MNSFAVNRSSSAQLWISIGAGLFLLALTVSAKVIPQLRLLHLLQAFIYIAVMILAPRGNAYAMGAGATMAVAWNCVETFGPHLTQAGAVMISSFLHTGHIEHLDTMMVPIGGAGHIILMVACLATFFQQTPGTRKWWKFLTGGVLVLGYFALIISVALPR